MTPRQPTVEIMDQMMVDILRRKTPAEKMNMATGMWESARVMLRGAIRQEHPGWSEEAVNQEIARRISHGLVDQGKINHDKVNDASRARHDAP